MARLVRHDRNRPYTIQVEGKTIALCACGLSKNKPYCDGSHRQTWDEEEGNLYAYDENRQRIRVQLLDETGNPITPPSEYPPEQ